jgi:CDP-2,3-bis-(O-geranylgeranyl)-sn-glycerol synthase
MWEIFLKAFYLLWPAYLANMAPVIFAKLNWLNFLARPIDGGRKIGNCFIFGENKTWRGLAAGILGGLVASGIQAGLYNYDFFQKLSIVDYSEVFFWLGLWGGWGAILGDLVKSFLKRRLKIAAGRPWPLFDQLDFVVGFFIFTFWLVDYNWQLVAAVGSLTLILHPLTNITAYFLKIKKVWW